MAVKFNILSAKQVLDSWVAQIKAEFPGSKPEIRKSFLNILGRAFSLIIHGNYLWLRNIADIPFIALCPVEFLDSHGNDLGVTRKGADGAEGIVIITGVNASTVAVGDRLVSISDNIQYEATAIATIVAGTANLSVRSLNFGLSTNKVTGIELEFVSPPVGIDTTATVDANSLDGGADREADEPYRQRLLFKKRSPNQGGAPSDYIQAALAFPEVTRAFVFPKEDGLGTVRVRFMMDNKFVDGIPQAADEVALKAFLETKLGAQVDIFASAPIAQPEDMNATIDPDTPALRTDITKAYQDLILREAAPGVDGLVDGTIFISKIRQAISNVPGENDNIVNTPAGNLVPATIAHIITPGNVTFT